MPKRNTLRRFILRYPLLAKCILINSSSRLIGVVVLCTLLGGLLNSDFYMKLMNEPVIPIQGANRSRCCATVNNYLDVCGNSNCLWPCPYLNLPFKPSSFNENNGFFHETSGAHALNTRQACAVESLALNNPDLKIYVLMSGNAVDYNTSTMKALKMLKNVFVYAINLSDYFVGTPLEYWYFCTTWNYGPYAISHLSDALRLLTLYKFGGYYFDLDIIMLKPVINLRNFIVAEDENSLAAGAFHVEYLHPIIQMAIEEFRTTYKKNIWGHNGPLLVTRVLRRWCSVENLAALNSDKCYGFDVLSPETFYPINWAHWERYFSNEEIVFDPRTIGIHVWNKKSASMSVFKNSSQVYTKMARLKCPSTFSEAPAVF